MDRRSLLRHPSFRLFWAGQGLAQVGFQLAAVAMPVVAVSILHADDAQMGYLNAAQTAAFLLLGLLAGGWVDRWRKRRVMIVADVARAAIAAIIPIVFLTGHLAMWHLYAVAFLLGCATVFFDVAYQSYVPYLVEDEDVASANGLLESTSQIARLGGPAVGGLLLRIISAPLLLLADVIGFLFSAVFLLFVRDDEEPHPREERQGLITEIREGLTFVASHQFLRRIVATTALSNAGSTIVFTLETILILRILGIPPEGLGLLLSLGPIGGLLGSMAASRLTKRFGEGPTLRLSVLVSACAMLLVPLTVLAPRWAAFGMLVAFGALFMAAVLVYNIVQVSARQRVCPKRLLGRMNASIRFIVWGIMPIAALVAGWLGDLLGTVGAIWVGVAITLAACLPLWTGPIGRMRDLPRRPDETADQASPSGLR